LSFLGGRCGILVGYREKPGEKVPSFSTVAIRPVCLYLLVLISVT